MVYVKYSAGIMGSYWSNSPEGRANIVGDAVHEAEDQVKTQYPYAVIRDRQELTRFAEGIYLQWESSVTPARFAYLGGREAEIRSWKNQLGEQNRLYVSTFVGKYLEEIAKKDEAARPKPQPQPQPQPAATPTGAIITEIKAEHTGDVHRYWLRLTDPTHLEEAYDLPVLRVDFSDTPVSDAPTATTSSSYGASSAMPGRTTASSSSGAYEATYRTPQKKQPRVSWEKR